MDNVETNDYRVPLVIGVTGHRDLLPGEHAQIKCRVKEFLQGLKAEFPQLPLLVMTPLAEGADRIAAEVAHELEVPTVVLLPMPRQIYQSDFQGDSLVEFHAMLDLGEVVELPLLRRHCSVARLATQPQCGGHSTASTLART